MTQKKEKLSFEIFLKHEVFGKQLSDIWPFEKVSNIQHTVLIKNFDLFYTGSII